MADGVPTWIASTDADLVRAIDTVQTQRESEDFDMAREGLNGPLATLAKLEKSAESGRGMWYSGVDAPPQLWESLQSAQTNLGRRALERVIREVSSFAPRAEDAVRAAWQQHVTDQTGNVGELLQLAQALREVPGLTEIAIRFDSALVYLQELQSTLPDATAAESLAAAVELLHRLRARLPDAVKSFVTAATVGGAAITSLDDEVRTWLVENGAVHAFKIVPGKPSDRADG